MYFVSRKIVIVKPESVNFTDSGKKVKKGRLYATAHGVYEASLNGQTVGDYRMAPGWTSYHNRLQYQIYDVTEMLATDNKIAITVGNC